MWFQRAFIASRGSSVIAVAMDQDDRIDTILNIFLTVKRNILEYCLENRRMDSKYIASIREGLCEAFKIILQLAPTSRISVPHTSRLNIAAQSWKSMSASAGRFCASLSLPCAAGINTVPTPAGRPFAEEVTKAPPHH